MTAAGNRITGRIRATQETDKNTANIQIGIPEPQGEGVYTMMDFIFWNGYNRLNLQNRSRPRFATD